MKSQELILSNDHESNEPLKNKDPNYLKAGEEDEPNVEVDRRLKTLLGSEYNYPGGEMSTMEMMWQV